jgi:predicted Zn-dependent protease
MPICWYPDPQIWDLCPGYEQGNEHFSREIMLSCVFCHNGRMVLAGAKANVYEKPIPHGIGCERCHGPGEKHVAFWTDPDSSPSTSGDTIVNPRSLPREQRIQVCFQCHFGDSRTSERVHRRGRSLVDFRPGSAMTDVMVPFSLRTVPRLEFGLSAQADRMLRSRCYRESDGGLECLTCHDPHVSVYSEDRPSDFFTRRCLECHELEACTASPRRRASTEPPDDCVACHMRTAEADDQRHAVFTDHWIRKEIDAAGEETFSDEPVAVFAEQLSGLTPAEQAFYRARATMLIAAGLPSAVRPEMRESAETLFREAIRGGLDDAGAWVFLGEVEESRGRLSEAERAFERAHAADPESREEAFNLGTVKLRLGKVREAETIIRKLVANDPDDVGALAELGRCALISGRNEEALALYDRAIPLAPTLASLRTNRGAALARLGRLEEATRAVEEATRLSPDDPELWVFWGELLKRTGRAAGATEAALIAQRLQRAAAKRGHSHLSPQMGQ